MTNPENSPTKFHLTDEQREAVARGVARYDAYRQELQTEHEEAKDSQTPPVTADAEIVFCDAKEKL